MASDDTEITLGVGKLLGLFFLLAAICGVFFSIGYSLGKSTGREQALNDQPASSASAGSTAGVSSEEKPSAAVATKSSPEAAGAKASGDMTFYKAVRQSNADTRTPPKELEPAVSETSATKSASAKKDKDAGSSTVAVVSGTPETKHLAPVTGAGTFVVQIAALSREDDAVALAGALRKKSYNVFVVNNPVTNDKLYHVQVGPFASLQDAEAMKLKLTGEGYSPIVKR